MRPVAVVVMGVSASGKSTVAAALAERLGLPWLDADDLHPPANVEAMRGGRPLTDEDRAPWLDAVGAELERGAAADGIVVACSALRRAYRDRLRGWEPGVLFIHLTAPEPVLAARAAARVGHFMPPALLASQLATLEPLESDELGVTLDVSGTPAEIVDAAASWLAAPTASRRGASHQADRGAER